jgi:hypothetical protein
MQIQSQAAARCPFAHRRAESAPAAPPPTVPNPPKATDEFSIDEVMCPVLKTGVREGRLQVDAEGNATGLNAYLRDDLKVGWALRQVFVKGGKSASDSSAAEGDTINLRNLRGSSLDHTADSQILRDGFSQERMDLALSFSADGERLTLADLGKFQQHLLGEEPGLKGKLVGGMEFAAVVSVFGRTDALGQRYISNADFVSLFRDNKFPADWESRQVDKTGLWDVGAAAVEFFRDHPGEAHSAMANQLPGASPSAGGVCPFKHGQQFDLAEAARAHADKLA